MVGDDYIEEANPKVTQYASGILLPFFLSPDDVQPTAKCPG